MQDFVAVKNTKHGKKHRQPNRLVIFLLATIGLLGLLFLVFKSIHFGDFFRDFDQQTILLVHKDVGKSAGFLLTADFSTLTLEVVPLDTEVEVDLGDYGHYRLQAVYPLLAAVEKKPLNFVRSTYSFSLGRIIDEAWGVEQQLTSINTKPALNQVFFNNIWSFPGSLNEKLAWLALVSDSHTEVVFTEIETNFPLAKKVKNTDSSMLLCTIAVINTTAVNGLAGKIDQVLDADGFSVIRTGNDSQTLAKTELIVGSDKNTQTNCQRAQTKIESLLPGKAVITMDDNVTKQFRADLVLKIGADLER
ncbi:MAG: LytR C-terminal domain-containing protein [Candidatus Pacebacteria bacterium]|nr:LytR C-terminal domain-containing protein [Candidatus Paceibacterota bacterium]